LEAYGIETVWVNFDQYALNEDTLLLVEEVITHPDYNWGPYSNPHDVGALILAEPVTDITPANLPDEGLLKELKKAGDLRPGPEGTKFTVVGYGGILDWPPPQVTYDDYRRKPRATAAPAMVTREGLPSGRSPTPRTRSWLASPLGVTCPVWRPASTTGLTSRTRWSLSTM